MKEIILASTNPVKIDAVRKGFGRVFPGEIFEIHTLTVPSDVSDQPATDEEAYLGACNRAVNAAKEIEQADYWVGIEGGIETRDEEMAAFAWVVVLSNGRIGKGRTGTFFLPRAIADLVHQGKELGEADDIVFGQSNTKQSSGAVGLLTKDVINRAELYAHAVVLALIPFCNTELFS